MAGLASEVIKEYLVSLGFKVAEKSASDVNICFRREVWNALQHCENIV